MKYLYSSTIFFLLMLASYYLKNQHSIPQFLIYSTQDECPVNFFNTVIFQLSSSFLTIAFISMIGDAADKTVYGTPLAEYRLERPRVVNWSNLVTAITVISLVNLFSLLFQWHSLIIWFALIGLTLLVLLIKIISDLYFENQGIRLKILMDYKSLLDGSISIYKKCFIISDLQTLFYKTQEHLNNKRYSIARENFKIYSSLICYSTLIDLSYLSSTAIKDYKQYTKQMVMNFSFLIEECKSSALNRNDIAIDAAMNFLIDFFSEHPCNEKSIYLLDETLGGYKAQILQNNFLIPYNSSFDFCLIHFLAQGKEDAKKHAGAVESLKYVHASMPEAINVKDYQDWTPLLEASEYGQDEIVKFILENNAIEDINHCDINGITALEIAWINEHYSICKMLLEYGAEIEKVKPVYKDAIRNYF